MLPLKAVALQPTPDQISERCEVSELLKEAVVMFCPVKDLSHGSGSSFEKWMNESLCSTLNMSTSA